MKRNNIMPVGIVLILLFLTYNMALASDGSQESGGIWAWLNDSKNSAAVQAIVGIAQAIAAVLTLGAMIYLGNRQNKMVDVQIVEKRERIYEDLISSINKNVFCYPTELLKKNLTGEKRSELMISYMVDMNGQLNHIRHMKERLSFIFNQNFVNKVSPLIDKEIELLTSLTKLKQEYNNQYYIDEDSEQAAQLFSKVGDFEKNTSDVLVEIKNLFNEELIFRGK